MTRIVLACLVSIILFCLACAPSSRQADGAQAASPAADSLAAAAGDGKAADPPVYRGHYVFGHEVRSLNPCGADKTLWVTDASGLLAYLHGELADQQEPYGELFVVVAGWRAPPPADGFGADYAGELIVESVLYAAAEGFDCTFDWSRFLCRAQGNEPFWNATVDDAGLTLQRLGDEPLRWPQVEMRSSQGELIFFAEEDALGPVELVLVREPCRDSMSGAYHGLTARLSLGDEHLSGCAMPGASAGE